jgi:hypothetical protein
MPEYLWTGQSSCYDSNGTVVPCRESGQDGEFRTGMPWPEERFSVNGELVLDNLTGLQWLKNANIGEFPVTWQEALDYAAWMNRENIAGHADWRMPNRRELRSLMAFEARKPALPAGHPFENVRDVYWSSTSSFFEPDWAWALYFNKGATGVGFKLEKGFHLWPVASKVE